jgi:cell shape-determining protein MreC
MTTKTIIAALLSTLALAAPAIAHDEVAETVEERLGTAKSRLNLTPQQEEQLRPLLKDESDRMRAIQNKYGIAPTPENRRAKLEAMSDVRRDFRTKVSNVLTPEQLMEWDRIRMEAMTRAQQQRLNQ